MNVDASVRGKSLLASITGIVWMAQNKKEHQIRNANMSYYVSTINRELSSYVIWEVFMWRKKKRKKFACANGTFRISYACGIAHI